MEIGRSAQRERPGDAARRERLGAAEFAALFVTPRTVELHLTNAYRKLGIGSRSELVAALSEPSHA